MTTTVSWSGSSAGSARRRRRPVQPPVPELTRHRLCSTRARWCSGSAHTPRGSQPGGMPVLCEGPLDAVAVDVAAARTGRPMVGVAACGTAFTASMPSCSPGWSGTGRSVSPSTPTRPAGTPPKRCGVGSPTTAPGRSPSPPCPTAPIPPTWSPPDTNTLLADLVRHARPAGQVVCDNTLDRCRPGRQPGPTARRVPAAAPRHHDGSPPTSASTTSWYLANRLNIDPTVAAAEATAFNPTLFADRAADRIIDHCHQLAPQLDPPTTDQDLQDIPTDARIARRPGG